MKRKNKMKTQSEWEEEMCRKIIPLIRDTLYLDFRYLDTALHTLIPEADPAIMTMATDGIYLRYSCEQILRLYPSNPLFLQRAFLHTLLHCIFRHLWIRRHRDPFLWNISCDIAVEYMVDSLPEPSVKRVLSGIRTGLYQEFSRSEKAVTAANIYDILLGEVEERRNQLRAEFYVDDHRYWPADEKQSPMQKKAGDLWDKIGRRADHEMSSKRGDEGEGYLILHSQMEAAKARRTYEEFLRRFTVLHEEMHIDQDSFDPGYYAYGLRLYKNMPLIEHPESRETSKIKEFVIAIDTSYSTSGKLVEMFLRKTIEIIRQRDQFFRESRIHIIQADSKVRTHDILKDEEDIRRIMKGFDLVGGGSTDFRPVFSYINQEIEEGRLKQLRGMLYFTDGKGTFPMKAPAYKVAFVFIGDDRDQEVPAWAMKVNLKPWEL